MSARRYCWLRVIAVGLCIQLWIQEARAFDGCHTLEWTGWTALRLWLYPGLPVPVCKGSLLEVRVRHRYGVPNSSTGCVTQAECPVAPISPEVQWNLPNGGEIVESCHGKKWVRLGWPGVGIYTVGASLAPFSNGPGFPTAIPTPPTFQVGVYELHSVAVIPNEVRPSEQATVQALIFPGIPNVTVSFSVEKGDFDAGHVLRDPVTNNALHTGGTRPTGYVQDPQGMTNRLCILAEVERTYHAPEVSGENKVKATVCGDDTKEAIVKVKIPNLVALGTGNGYNLIGATTKHPDGWYVTPGVRTALQTIASRYFAETGLRLDYNDASLVWGGKFDIDGSWGGSHSQHREGIHIDVRHWSITNHSLFMQFVDEEGGTPEVHGSGSNKHYHVIF